MARPIEPTPTLKGEDAKRFIEEMKKPPTSKEKAFIKRAISSYKTMKPKK
jgi:hypothetical protein